MHASIALGLMMVGGWIAPQPDFTIIPLKDDLCSLVYIQEMESQGQFQHTVAPPVDMIDRPKSRDDLPPPYQITDWNPPYRKAAEPRPHVMPEPPTQAGQRQAQPAIAGMPLLPGAGLAPSGGPKPFSGLTVTSSPGFSPWMYLYRKTGNGAIDPYFAYVQPALQQQQFNQQINGQLNNLQATPYPGSGYGTPGVETPMGNPGMADPQIFNNYHGYYPQSQ